MYHNLSTHQFLSIWVFSNVHMPFLHCVFRHLSILGSYWAQFLVFEKLPYYIPKRQHQSIYLPWVNESFSISLISTPKLVIFVLFDLGQSLWCERDLIFVLIHISLNINDVEQLFGVFWPPVFSLRGYCDHSLEEEQ